MERRARPDEIHGARPEHERHLDEARVEALDGAEPAGRGGAVGEGRAGGAGDAVPRVGRDIVHRQRSELREERGVFFLGARRLARGVHFV